MNRRANKTKLRTRIVVSFLLIFCGALFAGWQYLNYSITARVKKELVNLELGSSQIGRSSFSMSGIEASDIQFRSNPTDPNPWLKIGTLEIKHALSELLTGVSKFDRLIISDTRAVIDLEPALSFDMKKQASFDLSLLTLPATQLEIRNATIVLQQADRPDLLLENLSGTLSENGDKLQLQGSIEKFWGGTWKIDGTLNPKTNTLEGVLNTDRIELVDGQWQTWPGVPDNFNEILQADASAGIEVRISQNEVGKLNYEWSSILDTAALRLPQFDLPIEILQAKVSGTDSVIEFSEIIASSDQVDQITGSGNVRIDQFPIVIDFKADIVDASAATLRKIVPDVPILVSGRASGNIAGAVAVEHSLRTTVTLASDVNSDSSKYGEIAAQNSTVHVQLDSLVFDQRLEFESVNGTVVVNATTAAQSARDIFSTLELSDLHRQLELESAVDGSIELMIPFQSASDINSWTMAIKAQSDSAVMSQLPLSNFQLTGSIENGLLRLSKIIGTPIVDPSDATAQAILDGKPLIIASAEWPLTAQVENPNEGSVFVRIEQTPAEWILAMLERQIAITQVDVGATVEEPDVSSSFSDRISGAMTASIQMSIPVADPNDISGWAGTGKIEGSKLSVDSHTLNIEDGTLSINDNQVSINSLIGKFADSADLRFDGRLDLIKGEIAAATLKANQLPLAWAVEVAQQFSPAGRDAMDVLAKDFGVTSRELDGQLAIELELQDGRGVSESPTRLNAKISAEKLTVKGHQLADLVLDCAVDSQNMEIEGLDFRVGESGKVNLGGNWQFNGGDSAGTLTWQQVPLDFIAGLLQMNVPTMAGSTTGKIDVTPAGEAVPNDPIAFNINGDVAVDELRWAGVKARRLAANLKTENRRLLVSNFKSDDVQLDAKVSGELGLSSPFDFIVTSEMSSLPLTKIFELPSVVERVGQTAAIEGIANAKLELAGTLAPFDWQSTGKVEISEPRISNQSVSNISATWHHIGSDWKRSTAIINAFGGKIEMMELSSDPERIKVSLKNLDSKEVALIFPTAIQVTGNISGDASLNDWDLSETRWADLHLNSASIVAGRTELGELKGDLEFREDKLTYKIGGSLLAGKLRLSGETKVENNEIPGAVLPIKVRWTGASLNRLYGENAAFRSLRLLDGTVSVRASLLLNLASVEPRDRLSGDGRVQIENLNWNRDLLTREVVSEIAIGNGRVEVQNLKADLNRGQIFGRASIPFQSNLDGFYEVDVRHLDLERLLDVLNPGAPSSEGLLDARLSGQIGKTVTGQGTIGVERASFVGLSIGSVKVPIQFRFDPNQNAGKVELRRSKFRLFDGTVSGKSTFEFGRQFNIDTDLKVTGVNIDSFASSLAGVNSSGNGKLSGRLILKGRSIRNSRDLAGSFDGSLARTQAFKLPLLSDLTRFLGGNQIENRDFDSKDIRLRLGKGRIDIDQLNLDSSLAQIAINGSAFLDGRLKLDVVGKVDRINQPTLIDQLAGSPLAQFQASPIRFYTEASDFLSERLVFVQVGGTFTRPQFQLNTGEQLREEAIRYFLRGSQILPNQNMANIPWNR